MDDEFIETTRLTGDSGTETATLTCEVPAGVSGRLDQWLATQVPNLSRARIQALIREGLITTSRGGLVKASARPVAGEIIRIHLPAPTSTVPRAENIPLTIIHEDDDLLVLDKPAGLVVHPAPGHASGTLVNALLHHCHTLEGVGDIERPGIVHRLDKETSGLMVVAKNESTMRALVRLFRTGDILKEYLALVHGAPPQESGTIITLIGRHPVDRKRMAVLQQGGRNAVTHYTVERRLPHELTLVRCRIETGRTHQIRVHMRSLGCPLVGDSLYGRPGQDRRLPLPPARQMLHATKLAFSHPTTGAPLSFVSVLPEEFDNTIAALSASAHKR